MLFRALIAALLTAPLQAIALEAGEFHLYGVNKAGIAFDMTPYGEGSVGDPDSRQGFRGQFASWVKPREASVLKPRRVCTAEDARGQCVRWELMHRVGRCTVWLAPSYRIACAAGGLPMSGVTYAGEKVDASRVGEIADARELYESFLRRYDGARPELAAVYRCKAGCKDSLPATLIFLWLGD
jgi:hypothetical protein